MRLNASNNADNNNNKGAKMLGRKPPFQPRSDGEGGNVCNRHFSVRPGASVSTIDSKALPREPAVIRRLRERCYRLTSAAGGLLDDRLMAQMTRSGFAQLLRAEHVTLGLEVALKHGKRGWPDYPRRSRK